MGQGMEMDRVAPILVAAPAVLALEVSPAPARAQANRTFVSGFGSDSNDCSFGSPCGAGISFTAGAATYIAETTISGNTGNGFIVRPGASVLTFGNNRNTDTTNSGALTPISAQ